MVDSTQWAYAAGVLDGEGCITIQRRLRKERQQRRQTWYHELRISVSQGDRRMVDWHAGLFGGTVHAINSTHRSVNYQWQINGNRAAVFLRGVAPYVVTKRDEVELALLFQSQMNERAKGGPARLLTTEEQQAREAMRVQLKAMKTARLTPNPAFFSANVGVR